MSWVCRYQFEPCEDILFEQASELFTQATMLWKQCLAYVELSHEHPQRFAELPEDKGNT